MGLWAPPERDEEEGSRRAALRTHGARLLLALVLAVVTYMLFPAAPASEVAVYEVGSVAPENVIAPYAFRVPKAAPELAAEHEAAVRTVVPVFAFDTMQTSRWSPEPVWPVQVIWPVIA